MASVRKTKPKRSDADFGEAFARGQEALEREPRARAARYDDAKKEVTIDLINGCTYVFPAQLVQELSGASRADLVQVEVEGLGFNLHWPKLDVDLYVPALVAGVFGTQDWMVKALARRAGRSTSPAKAAAARANGAKGGRPRKKPGVETRAREDGVRETASP